MSYAMSKYIYYLFYCLRFFYSLGIILLNINHLSINLIINIISIPLIFIALIGMFLKNNKLIFISIIGTWIHLLFLMCVFISVPIYLLLEVYSSKNNITVLKMNDIKIALLFWLFVACNILFFLYSVSLSSEIYTIFYRIKLIKQKNSEMLNSQKVDVVSI